MGLGPVSAAIAVLGHALSALGHQGVGLAWLHRLSAYHGAYGGSPLLDGMNWTSAARVFGISAVIVDASSLALNRRVVGA